MAITSSVLGIISSLALSVNMGASANFGIHKAAENVLPKKTAIYGAVKCKTGFKKAKQPAKLGGKLGCYNIAKAKAGKIAYTKGLCGSCHGASGVAPYTQTNANMINQGYGLNQLTEAYNAHSAEMAGAVMNSTIKKNLLQFLLSIK